MTVREGVLHRDVRAFADLSPTTPLNLRRFLSVFVLVGIDVAAIALAALLVAALTRTVGPPHPYPGVFTVTSVCLVVVLVFLANGLYGRRFMRHSARRLARASLMAIALVALAALVMGLSLDHLAAALTIVLATALAFAGRAAYDWALACAHGDCVLRPVVLVGRPHSCEQIKTLVAGLPQSRDSRICGIITDRTMSRRWQEENGLEVLGLVDELEAIIAAEQPVELIVRDLDLARGRLPGLLDACRRRHIDLKIAAADADLTRERICLIPDAVMPLFATTPSDLTHFQFVAKRCLDLIGGTALLLLLAPLMLVIALLVKLTSRGPVLFVDERIGLGQRTFRLYKFRTMQRDAAARQAEFEPLNEAGGTLFKIRHDPRVTPVGRVLRRTSLDELPQLFNVLKGDMSLVGPRPLPLRDFRLMDDVDKRRHVVLPGITGLWQVSGRSDLSFADMVELDFRYIESWSIAADISILARTVGAVCGLRGAC